MMNYYEPATAEKAIRFNKFIMHLNEIKISDKDYDMLCKDAQELIFDPSESKYAQIVCAIKKATRSLYNMNGKNPTTDSYIELVTIVLTHSINNELLSHIPKWMFETLREFSLESRDPIDANEFLDRLVDKMIGPCDRINDRIISAARELNAICKDKIDKVYPIPMYENGIDGYIAFTKKLQQALPRRKDQPTVRKNKED